MATPGERDYLLKGVVPSQPVVAAQPVVVPQPVVAVQPVVVPQPVVAAEPVVVPQPVIAAHPVVTGQPVVVAQPVAQPVVAEPVVAPQLGIHAEIEDQHSEDSEVEEIPEYPVPPRRPNVKAVSLHRLVFVQGVPKDNSIYWNEAKLMNINYARYKNFAVDCNKTETYKTVGMFKYEYMALSLVNHLSEKYRSIEELSAHTAADFVLYYWRVERAYIRHKIKKEMEKSIDPGYISVYGPTAHHTTVTMKAGPKENFTVSQFDEVMKKLAKCGTIIEHTTPRDRGPMMAWTVTFEYIYQAVIVFLRYDNYNKDKDKKFDVRGVEKDLKLSVVYRVRFQDMNMYQMISFMISEVGVSILDFAECLLDCCCNLSKSCAIAYNFCCRLHCSRRLRPTADQLAERHAPSAPSPAPSAPSPAPSVAESARVLPLHCVVAEESAIGIPLDCDDAEEESSMDLPLDYDKVEEESAIDLPTYSDNVAEESSKEEPPPRYEDTAF